MPSHILFLSVNLKTENGFCNEGSVMDDFQIPLTSNIRDTCTLLVHRYHLSNRRIHRRILSLPHIDRRGNEVRAVYIFSSRHIDPPPRRFRRDSLSYDHKHDLPVCIFPTDIDDQRIREFPFHSYKTANLMGNSISEMFHF